MLEVRAVTALKYGLWTLARNRNTARNMPVFRQRWHNYEKQWLAITRILIGARNMSVLDQYLTTSAVCPVLV